MENKFNSLTRNYYKFAKKSPQELDLLIAALHAKYNLALFAHWTSKGDSYYSDHLLFQKIYSETFEHIDLLLESALPFFPDLIADPTHYLNNSLPIINDASNLKSHPVSILNVINVVDKFIQNLIDLNIVNLNNILADLKDLNTHHLYLINQRIKA
jgi:DNA-binding ferritin-like protein